MLQHASHLCSLSVARDRLSGIQHHRSVPQSKLPTVIWRLHERILRESHMLLSSCRTEAIGVMQCMTRLSDNATHIVQEANFVVFVPRNLAVHEKHSMTGSRLVAENAAPVRL